jgi:UDP-N-acetylglucosamine 1-carboxyvinyltransferase
MMSAALAFGETAVQNASWEPEVEDLAQLLVKMGSEIEHRDGILFIQGRSDLHGARHAVIPDRMEAGTYLLAGAITRGAISVTGVIPEHLRSLLSLLEETGGDIDRTEDSVSITMNRRPRPLSVKTAPYPGFPTDLQSPLVVLLATADGMSTVEERIFENRFTYARDLQRMGAIIEVSGCVATITGVQELHPVQASAPDIRAGAALVLAALAADGESTISNLTQIDRGYEAMEEKLSSVGAQIERIG